MGVLGYVAPSEVPSALFRATDDELAQSSGCYGPLRAHASSNPGSSRRVNRDTLQYSVTTCPQTLRTGVASVIAKLSNRVHFLACKCTTASREQRKERHGIHMYYQSSMEPPAPRRLEVLNGWQYCR